MNNICKPSKADIRATIPSESLTPTLSQSAHELGFSLAEAITTVFCALVLASLALPNFSGIINTTNSLNQRLSSTASTHINRVQQALNSAR